MKALANVEEWVETLMRQQRKEQREREKKSEAIWYWIMEQLKATKKRKDSK